MENSVFLFSVLAAEVEFRRRTQLLYELFRRKVFGFKQVQQVVNEYYKKPQQVLNQFDIKF